MFPLHVGVGKNVSTTCTFLFPPNVSLLDSFLKFLLSTFLKVGYRYNDMSSSRRSALHVYNSEDLAWYRIQTI